MMSQRVSQAGFKEITFAIEVPNDRSCQTPPAIETLFADMPKTEDDWQKRRMDLGLSKPISIIRTFLQVVNAAAESSFPNAGDEASKAKGLLQAYGMLLRSQYLAPIRNFTVLIYWCLCRIISITRKLPGSTIDEYRYNITLEHQAKRKGSRSFQKEQTSVLWPIRIEQALRPLIGNRASEFFLLWGPPTSKYRALWEQDTPEREREFVAMVEKSCAPGGQDCTVSFSLPFLVVLIGRGLFEIADVNKAFRTELSEAEFGASIYNISLQVHRMRFSHPMPGAQDTLPEDCESTESIPQRKTTQSLACIMANFFRRLKPIAIGMLEERGTSFLYHHNSSRGDEAYTLSHDKTGLFVGTGDGAEGKNPQETRMFRPINTGRDGRQTTSLPTNGSAASSSSQTLRARQSDDHPDGWSNEHQSDQSGECQFDDQTAGEAAPTRPRKRQKRGMSREPTPQPTSNEAEDRPKEDADEIGDDGSPGSGWRADRLPGRLPVGTRLDTPAKSRAVSSPGYNPSPTGSADSPSVAISLELRLAPGQEQNPLAGPNISLDGRSLPVEHLTCAVNGDKEVGIEQQTPLGGGSVDHHTFSETIFSRLEILSQAAGSLYPLRSPTTQFQTRPNDRVHTAENNGNLTFLGGTLWRAGNGLGSLNLGQHGELASLPPRSQPPSDTQEDMVAATGGGLTNKPRLPAVEQLVTNARDNDFMDSFASGADLWSIEFAEDTRHYYR